MRGPKHCGLGFHSHVRVQSEMFNCLASISIDHYGCLVGELCSSLRPFQEGSWDSIAAILGVRLLLGVVRPREAVWEILLRVKPCMYDTVEPCVILTPLVSDSM